MALVSYYVPTDGVVIVAQFCDNGCDSPPEPLVVVRDFATGGVVEGTLARIADLPDSERAFTWRATSPLVPGGYGVEFDARTPPTVLDVVAPVEVGLDAVTVTPTIDVYEDVEGEATCCPAGPLDSCGGNYCYYSAARRFISASVQWTSESAPAHFSPYLDRVTWDGQEPEPWQLASSGGLSTGRFDAPQAEYCYTLELKNVIDGSIAEVERRCLPHPPDAELGVYDLPPDVMQNQLGRCELPPVGNESAWCEARAAFCSEQQLTQCTSGLETHCADGGGDPDHDRSNQRTIRTEGCAVARPGQASPGSWFSMLFAAALGAGFLRRRRSASRV